MDIETLSRESGYAPGHIHNLAWKGLLPRPDRRGPGAAWPPLALKLLRQYRDNHHPGNRRTRVDLAFEHGLEPKGH